MNKLPLVNLPVSYAEQGSYERQFAIKADEILSQYRQVINALIDQTTNLPIYANNAAAIAGGLHVGSFYRTGANPDPVMVVH